jgi:Spy/CpxP family protein refolding chaperone
MKAGRGRPLALLLSVALAVARAHASGPDAVAAAPPPPPFMKEVFSPKVVMAHQQEIGLRPEQVDAIKAAMAESQRKLLDLQWRLDAETEALAKLLAADRLDEAAALAGLDRVTALERDVKRVNFALLVQIKNALDPEQQAKLRAYRPSPPPGRPPLP